MYNYNGSCDYTKIGEDKKQERLTKSKYLYLHKKW